MKKPWLLGVCAILLLGFTMLAIRMALGLNRPQAPRITLALIGRSSTGYSDICFSFAATNMTVRSLRVVVGPKRAYTDYPRGDIADLLPRTGAHFNVLLPGDQMGWGVVARCRRMPSRPESWLRSLGAWLRLCTVDPKWEEVAVIDVAK